MKKLLFIFTFLFSLNAYAEVVSSVMLNNRLEFVFWNDGDSFRVVKGRNKGLKARLKGFNTLESYGPVHKFGGFHPKELYINAKKATMHNRGTHGFKPRAWNCSSGSNKDGYGRVLVTCDSLAISLIEKGLAHVYSVKKTGGNKRYLAAQKKAQKSKIGLWAKGIPNYIMTSIHSIDEGGYKNAYNRFISSIDAHSNKMKHKNKYDICQWVCEKPPGDKGLESCMLYVPFERRYGHVQAKCLK